MRRHFAVLWMACALLYCGALAAQGIPLGSVYTGPVGTSATVNLGQPGATPDYLADTDNGLFALMIPFTTPASMASPSFGTPASFWLMPDSSNPANGQALYASASCYGTATTSGATVTWASGVTPSSCEFSTTYYKSGTPFYLCPTANTCELETISSCGSATTCTLTGSPATGCSSACPFQVSTPGAFLCGSYNGTMVNADWNVAVNWPGGCGTPASSTEYWLGMMTRSTTQEYYNTGTPCEFNNNIPTWPIISEVATFTSASSWPPNLSTGTNYQVDDGDGCLGEYIPITYTTTNRYTIVTSALVPCDVGAATCHVYTPAVAASSTLIGVTLAQGSSNPPVTGVVDLASGTTKDTLSKRGSCPIVDSAQFCFYGIDRVTSGVNEVVSTNSWTSGSNKMGVWVLNIVGTQSSSFDQSCYDSSTLTLSGADFTGCTTSTTSAANELILGAVINSNAWSCCAYDGNYLVPNDGSWNLLGVGFFVNTTSMPFSLFYKVVTSTGTPGVTGQIVNTIGSAAIATGTITQE